MPASLNTLAHIHWAHAVNSQGLLSSALDKGYAIEADILLNEQNVAVMAHPPAKDSDLTLEHFLKRVEVESTCIIKLDFKSYEAFQSALPFINRFDIAQRQRIWINADILRGSNAPEPVFPSAQFIVQANACQVGKLSIGWTTSGQSLEYTDDMVSEMLQLLETNTIGVTFPIKASLVRASWNALKRLYSTPSFGMTLWLNEQLDDGELEWLHRTLEESEDSYRNRTYYDLQGWNDLVQRKGW